MTEVRCPDCGEEKAPELFPRHSGRRTGRGLYCKRCHNARTRDTVRRLYGNSRHYHLRGKYGLGAAEVEERIARQGGLCALCEKRPATQVDHDHATGRVRGILCLLCNAGVGALGDDPAVIRNAIYYLERAHG